MIVDAKWHLREGLNPCVGNNLSALFAVLTSAYSPKDEHSV